MSTARIAALVAASLVVIPASAADAQQPSATDSLRLAMAQSQALATDPRAAQLALAARQSQLRVQSLAASWYPALALDGTAQYQSDVTRFGAQLPPTLHIPTPPHDTYDAHLAAQQPVVDFSIAPREALERAQLAESRAQLSSTLYALRQEVNDAFFSAAGLQSRTHEVAAAMLELEARLRDARDRVHAGAALPSDTAILAATLLLRKEDSLQIAADRQAALARLGDLLGRPVSATEPLALPAVGGTVAEVRAVIESTRARPEYAQFAASRARLVAQEAVDATQEKPRVSAFGRWGFGRPGLNMLNTSFENYWVAGVQVQWTPWTWGSTRRDREVLELQRSIVSTNEDAFSRQLRRSVESDITTMARLDSTLALDDRIIALRDLVEHETRVRFEEGVVTAADYADRSTDLLTARIARAQHRVDLAQARARFLTTLGLEVR